MRGLEIGLRFPCSQSPTSVELLGIQIARIILVKAHKYGYCKGTAGSGRGMRDARELEDEGHVVKMFRKLLQG